MSIHDPIADMLTRIRNAQAVGEKQVTFPGSRVKLSILKVLNDEGYIGQFEEKTINGKTTINVKLNYYLDKAVIEKIARISKPGLRVYKRCDELPTVRAGMGIAIISTSKGVMSERAARTQKLGGEVLCIVE